MQTNVVLPDLHGIRVLAVLNGLELFGHERGNIEVYKVLRDMGAEVVVGVNALPYNHVKSELSALGFKTFALPFGPQWSIQWVRKKPTIAFTNIWKVAKCSWVFSRKILAFRPSHLHLGSPLAYSYLSVALGLSTVPLVYRMGDCPPMDSPFNLRIWRMAMRRASRVVSISEYVRSRALIAGLKDISVIYNLAPMNDGENTNQTHVRKTRGEVSILYVGAVAEHKGLVLLVNAFAQLALHYPELRLDIVGGSRYDTNFRTLLMQLIESSRLVERVKLHRHVDNPSSFYQAAELHVAPSVWEEPLGNVVLEAKREGTPSVVFPSGGLAEMVRHKVDGYICREKSVEALVEGLRWMLDDPDRLRNMGEAAREDSEARFGRERFACAWADVYRSVI